MSNKSMACEYRAFDTKIGSMVYPPFPDSKRNLHLLWTGKQDKNGKRVFDGDILKDSADFLWIVFWRQREAGFFKRELDQPENTEYYFGIQNLKRLEVIGNIYENPELLKEKE